MTLIMAPNLVKMAIVGAVLVAGLLTFRTILTVPPQLTAGQERVLNEGIPQRMPQRSLSTDPVADKPDPN